MSENTPPYGRSGSPGTSDAAARGPWLAFAGCCTIWGSTFLVISIGNDVLDPLWAASIRLALAVLILFPLSWLTGQRIRDRASLMAAIRFGVLQFGVNFSLLYWGEKTLPSGIAAVCYATVPLSSALITSAMGLERLSPLKLAGALIAFAGVAVIGRMSGGAHAHLLGLGAVLLSATSAAFSNALLKRGPRVPPFAINAVGSVCGLVICLTLSRLFGERWVIPHEPAAIFSIVYLAVAGSVGAFVLLTWLVMRWPVTRVAFISVVVPVVAMLLGALVRHEPLTLASLGGSALVLAGWACGLMADRAAPRAESSPDH